MRIFTTDGFRLDLPTTHPFPAEKYERLRRRVEADGSNRGEPLVVPDAATDEQLRLVHDPDYVRRVVAGELDATALQRLGFPWSPSLVERSRRSVGATIAAARAALLDGVAVSLSGGTHHAFFDRGEGYCVFNDVVVAARVMQNERLARRVVVLDCDVHQGNGTAALARHDATLFTMSIHGARNFPRVKETSDLDVELRDGATDDEYLAALAPAVEHAVRASGAHLAFFLAGADPLESDRFGRLALTKDGLARRDRFVLERCASARLPVAVLMAGGYARDVRDVVDVHATTVAIAARIWDARRAGLDSRDRNA